MQLDARAQTILQLVVEAFIDDAQPVSSAALVRKNPGLSLSPATLRNAMAELEELGLLSQPHTSAGRVPTEKGLRVYLDAIMSPKLHPWDRSRLDAVAEAEPNEFLASLGHSLAGLSGQMSVVAVPRFLGSRFREVGLARIDARRVLAYFVSPAGLVQQKLVELSYEISHDELLRVQSYLNEHLTGRTLEEVRAMIDAELASMERERTLKAQAFDIARRALPDPELKLFIDGASHLASQPEFADVEKLRAVMRTIDDHAALLKLLSQVLDGSGVRVVLSSENALRDMPDLACVGGSWSAPAGNNIAISLLGPARMDYGRLVPLVRYATELFSRYWSRI